MRIVMDLQSCQSGSRLGGIGRYSIELAKAMARQGGKHDFWIVLNSLLPHAIAETRHAFSDLIPQDRIRVFETPPGIAELTNNKAKVRAAELIREQYLNSLSPDMVHISSLFEGLQEDVITSVGNLFSGSRTAVTLYDLIPLIQRERYLGNNDALNHYLGKIENLKKAGLLLSISEFSREEAIDVLGISPSNIVNISSAADKRFQPIEIREELSKQLLGKYGISRKFLMYTGSFDQRKNHPNLIKAFGLIPENIRKSYQLVIVGNGWDSLYKDLNDLGKKSGLSADDLVFAGHVSDADLLPLYNLCDLFVFPSLAEGFGLPVLEAMSCGTPTICSDCTSLPEVIGWSEATFDPRDPESIARKISQALTHPGFTDSLRMHGLKQAKKFSWDESAKRTISAFESQIEALPKVDGKMLPGLGKIYAQASRESIEPTALIEKIAELYEISTLPDEALLEMAQSIASNQHQTESAIAIANGNTLNYKTGWVTTWNTKCGIASYSKFLVNHFPAEVIIFAPEADDLVHVDESNVIRCWQSGKPDNLHRLLKEVKRSKIEALVIQFNYSFFDFPSFSLFLQDVTSHGVRVFITFHSTFDPSSTKRLANLKEALALCDGLIVHSIGDVTTLRKLGLVNSIDYLPQGIIDTQPAVINGLDFKDKRVIATYGFALPSKGLKEVVEAFSNLINDDGPHFHLLMVNSEYPDPISASLLHDIRTRLRELKIEDHATLVSDYLPDEISLGYLQKADLIIYAYQATGESSSAAVRMGIAAKRPVAVTPSEIFKDVESAVFLLAGSDVVAITNGIRSILELNATNDVAAVKVAESSKLWVLSHLYASLSKHLFWLISKPKLMRMNYVLPMLFSMSPTSEKQCFLGSNSELKTTVGEKIGSIVHTTNRDGYLLFGPYLSVASGDYQVVIYGDIRSGKLGTASVDVAIRNGALVLAKGTLEGANSHGVVSVLSFIIPEGGCTDLEVRVWVSDDTDLQVSMIEIAPWQGKQEVIPLQRT